MWGMTSALGTSDVARIPTKGILAADAESRRKICGSLRSVPPDGEGGHKITTEDTEETEEGKHPRTEFAPGTRNGAGLAFASGDRRMRPFLRNYRREAVEERGDHVD